ncbi:carbon-nitrogen hydrolase family protein [Thermobispora bispora]|uniref:Nitrilase/cyanide hydratase and apolipoprotein N-acyltransferase n=1 Tax=Thermobispora bispora (strain ATCC 19993 / DSM 43833 / CBS 139.67 / JCM 10125 / KCTC 9307 / NBRC 14880 / R51) TaxID=469371 RepID=D6Y354_THEBD|nr:carbon-nitrogen hydrolase family protein [Thermobispora bispora]ADG88929.1 Nitrilase/cyanide hydratase and apolipoprotein N- acyltransferase [Thermobispora bispora DSM 43833]MBX6167875.1 carbon-nitrogen hydrolase family protein [Thermobispora bispora]MDI9580705.1 carbon-nitrogen hydrolase family protein [Thermobispora sp.]
MTRVALCQIPVGHDPAENLKTALDALAQARGARLAVFPEAALARFGKRVVEAAQPLDGPYVTGIAEAAREHGIAVITGVFEPAGDGRVYNTTVAIDEQGRIAGTYRKIHLFDSFGARESQFVAPGDTPVVVELAGLRIGLITCYDVRFPELARALIDQGAEVFAVPAAWGSGLLKEDHWATLVRARAIENTTWTIAVGQAPHPSISDGFGIGRSMLVDPMGVVRLDLGPWPAVRIGEIDPETTERARRTLPCLEHRRLGAGRS